MEAEQVKRKLKLKLHLRQGKTQFCVEEEEEGDHQQKQEEFKASPSCSVSLIEQRPYLKKPRKKLPPKKPLSFKSKGTQVIQDGHRNPRRCKSRRARIDDLYWDEEAKCSVMERAEEVLENIADRYRCFYKCMLPSNVTHGFWLIFPKPFCSLHFPVYDTTVVLVDDCGKEYETNYLAERHGLSGGWRAFSLAHRLLKGDILVFHLIGPCTLKVHIIRVYSLEEAEAAHCLMSFLPYPQVPYPDKSDRSKKKAKKSAKALLLDVQPKHIQKDVPGTSCSNDGLVSYQSEVNSNGFGFGYEEVSGGSEVTDQQANESSCNETLAFQDRLLGAFKCLFTTGKVF